MSSCKTSHRQGSFEYWLRHKVPLQAQLRHLISLSCNHHLQNEVILAYLSPRNMSYWFMVVKWYRNTINAHWSYHISGCMGNCLKNLKILTAVYSVVLYWTPLAQRRDITCQDRAGVFQCPPSDFEKFELFQRQYIAFQEPFCNLWYKALHVSVYSPVFNPGCLGDSSGCLQLAKPGAQQQLLWICLSHYIHW